MRDVRFSWQRFNVMNVVAASGRQWVVLFESISIKYSMTVILVLV